MDTFTFKMPPKINHVVVPHHQLSHVVCGYARECNQCIPHHQLVVATCSYYYHQMVTYLICASFEKMNLKEELLRGIYDYRTQDGTGQPLAFCIAALQILDLNDPQCQVLILTPTRELAIARNQVLVSLGQYLGVTSRALCAIKLRSEIRHLSQRPRQIIFSTAARVWDLLTCGGYEYDPYLKLHKLKLFVLDSADSIFESGCDQTIFNIIKYIPTNTQMGLFTCNTHKDLTLFKNRSMHNPVQILSKNDMNLDSVSNTNRKVNRNNTNDTEGVLSSARNQATEVQRTPHSESKSDNIKEFNHTNQCCAFL
eukprot:174981_1